MPPSHAQSGDLSAEPRVAPAEVRVELPELRSFVVAALRCTGMPPDAAAVAADALVETDAMGVFTHGTKLLAGYLRKLQGGGYRACGQPRVERGGPSWAVVDGDSALGQIGGTLAIETALHLASQTGVAYVALRNAGHLGAVGYYAALAARAGCLAMVTGNDTPSVAAPGSRGAVLGSNPLAYGVPLTGRDPVLLDMATSTVAGGKIYAATRRGEPLPANWLIDANGRPTTDGSLYPQQACLAPMAGHKGYALALWCEVLSAVLPGGNITWQVGSWIFDEPSRPSWHNGSFLVLNVDTMTDRTAFDQRLTRLINELHSTPLADGAAPLLVPGEREWEHRRRAMKEGVCLPADVVEKLQIAARMTGVTPEWLPQLDA